MLFKPEGYYEAIDDNGWPVCAKYGGYHISDIPELCATPSLGRSLYGAYTSIRQGHFHMQHKPLLFSVFNITDTPDIIVDPSGGDFDVLQEVRYRRDVIGQHVGIHILTVADQKRIDEYSTWRFGQFEYDAYDQSEEPDYDIINAEYEARLAEFETWLESFQLTKPHNGYIRVHLQKSIPGTTRWN